MEKKRFDKKKFEKIEGLEALRKIADRQMIYDADGYGYFYDANGIFYRRHNEKFVTEAVDVTVAEIASKEWYVKKPFDVRTEMLSRPDEWVGAYENEQGTWFKVGFDMRSMVSVKTNLPYLRVANFGDTGVSNVAENDLDRCIPIEDVPVSVPNLN